MKKDWTYKKLGEVCTSEASNIALNKIADNVGDYPLFGASGYAKSIDFYKQENEYIGIVKDGAGVGRVGIYPAQSSLVGTMQYILPKSDVLLRYLYYVLKGLDLSKLVSGATIPHIYFKDYSKFSIPVPPISIQESIVAELDLLHSVISKKKEQLRELDNLAQSLFYQMFGDPITNPMGWEIKKLGEVCDVRDGTHDSPKYVQYSEYVLITSKNIVNGEIDFSSRNYITKEDYDSINKRSKVDVGDIIMPMIGTIGGPIIVKETSQKYCIKNVALIKFNITGVLNVYVKSILENQSYTEYLKSLNKGGTQKFIALGTIRTLTLPLPPLSLQQSFAAKVSAIEAQKQAITQSIREVEALLAERMDAHFG